MESKLPDKASNEVSKFHKTRQLNEARKLHMIELIKGQALDVSLPITGRKAQKLIIDKFVEEVGVHRKTAQKYYNEVKNEVFAILDLAPVMSNALAIVYDLMGQYQDLADESVKPLDIVKALDGKNNATRNLIDLVYKVQQIEVNQDKNQVLREKNQSDTAVGLANVVAKFEGSLDDKRELLKKSLRSKKCVRDVFNALTNSEIEDAEEVIEVKDFKGIVLDEEEQ